MAKNKKKLKMSGKPQVKPQEVGDPKTIDAPRDFPIWAVSIVFVLTTVIFFWDQLAGNAFIWEDFTEQVYPLQAFAARIFSEGNIPFWNSFTFSGMPLFADLQVGFFYPLNRLASLFLDADGVLSIGGLQIIIILHFFIAQLSMYSLMRYLKISSIGAMIGAVSFAFSFVMVCHVFHPMMVYHLAWFPLVIMYFMRGYSESSMKFTIISGLIFGGSMLAGHPQTMLYESLFLGIMFLWWFFTDKEEGKWKGSKLLVKISAGLLPFIIAVGIFSIQYLPAKEFADHSARSERSFEESAEGSLESGQIFTSVVPKFFGFIDGAGDQSLPWHLKGAENKYYLYWDTSFYFGITALMLGLFGAARRYKTREGSFFKFIAVFGLLFAFGNNFIIYEMFYNLPFFGLLRIPARIMFFAVIGFSVLAGFGFDELRKSNSTEHLSAMVKSTFALDELRKKAGRNFLIVFAITFGSVLLVTILAATGVLSALPGIATPEKFVSAVSSYGATALIIALIITVIAYLIAKRLLKPLVGGLIILVIAFSDLYIAGSSFNASPRSPEDSYKISAQMKELFTPKLPDDIFRVSMRHYSPSYTAMLRNQGVIDDIMLIEGYNQLIMKRLSSAAPDKKTTHDLFNVKYEIALDQQRRGFTFVERPGYYPRAWMVHKAIDIPADQVQAKMKDGGIDYLNEVVLEQEADISLSGAINAADKVECLEYNANDFNYKVSAESDGVLCFSEVWYPAWKAYIDGKEVDILHANYTFRAVAVPAGEHIVEMRYESDTYATGKWISIVTLLLSLGGLVFVRIREKSSLLA